MCEMFSLLRSYPSGQYRRMKEYFTYSQMSVISYRT